MRTRTTKGRISEKFNQEVNSDIQTAVNYITNDFVLVENNTALEHKEGGPFLCVRVLQLLEKLSEEPQV